MNQFHLKSETWKLYDFNVSKLSFLKVSKYKTKFLRKLEKENRDRHKDKDKIKP